MCGRARVRPRWPHGGRDEHLGAHDPDRRGLAGEPRRADPKRSSRAVATPGSHPGQPRGGWRARHRRLASMRIAEVTPLVVGTAWRNLAIVRVRTDEGLEGVGEVRMVNHVRALLGYLAHAVPTHVVGADPFDIEALVQRMWRSDYERAGATVMSGIAAVEIACWDIVGKALGQPIYRLLGGAVRDRIKAYANGWYTVERTPEEFHAAVKVILLKGYRALKLDPFGAGFYEIDREEQIRSVGLVEAVR